MKRTPSDGNSVQSTTPLSVRRYDIALTFEPA